MYTKFEIIDGVSTVDPKMIKGFVFLRSAFTVAVVGSAVVVKRQVKKRRKQQEEGVRSTTKLSWEEKFKELENSNNKVGIRTEK